MVTQIEPIVTVADLEAMPDEGNRYELIEGEIFMSRAPGVTHQLISGNLFAAIRTYLDHTPVGKVIATPGLILSDFDGVVPDLVFISNERLDKVVSGEHLIAAPDLVIEILSPGKENERRDRIVKRRLYGRYGVKEYWIADPQNHTIEIYRLGKRGLRLVAKLTGQGEITSTVLRGFKYRVSDIFEF